MYRQWYKSNFFNFNKLTATENKGTYLLSCQSTKVVQTGKYNPQHLQTKGP